MTQDLPVAVRYRNWPDIARPGVQKEVAEASATPKLVMKSEVTGRGEPIVLVPGGLTGWLSWRPHAQRLAKTRQVILVQLLAVDDDIGRITGFPAPVLLFKGVGSPDYLREIIDVLGEEFPDGHVHELPGAHALQIVSMDRFLEILGEFLSGRARGR